MIVVMNKFLVKLFIIQGDGDYVVVKVFIDLMGNVDVMFVGDLKKFDVVYILVDIMFEQGKDVLGL